MFSIVYRSTLLVLLVFPNIAFADFITYTNQLAQQTFSLGTKVGGSVGSGSLTTLNWNGILGIDFLFPKFDSNLGTLNSVQITFAGATGLTADILFANNQLAPFNIAGINVNMTTNIVFNDATNSVSSTGSNVLTNSTTATSSATPFNFGVGADIIAGSIANVPSSQFSTYIGTGTVTLPMQVQFLAEATTSNGAFAVTPFPILALNSVQISYGFTAVPEPGTLSYLVLLTIAGLVVRRRRVN